MMMMKFRAIPSLPESLLYLLPVLGTTETTSKSILVLRDYVLYGQLPYPEGVLEGDFDFSCGQMS